MTARPVSVILFSSNMSRMISPAPNGIESSKVLFQPEQVFFLTDVLFTFFFKYSKVAYAAKKEYRTLSKYVCLVDISLDNRYLSFLCSVHC